MQIKLWYEDTNKCTYNEKESSMVVLITQKPGRRHLIDAQIFGYHSDLFFIADILFFTFAIKWEYSVEAFSRNIS